MKTTLSLPVDTEKVDLGLADVIEQYRDLFETINGREVIAEQMTRLISGRRRINRQMVEKWFRREQRTYPSSVLLVTLLTACEQLKQRKEKAA
jgi:hypothetical protein